MIAKASPATTRPSGFPPGPVTSSPTSELCHGNGLATSIENEAVALSSEPPKAVPPSSFSRIEICAVPATLGRGTNVSWPVVLIAGGVANSPGLELASTTNCSCCADSSAGPARIAEAQPIDCGPLSSVVETLGQSVVESGQIVKLGGSFTGVTLIVIVCGTV